MMAKLCFLLCLQVQTRLSNMGVEPYLRPADRAQQNLDSVKTGLKMILFQKSQL